MRGAGGFVMLEIVMALGLFALVAVGMTQALDQIAQTSKLARQEAQLMRALVSPAASAAVPRARGRIPARKRS